MIALGKHAAPAAAAEVVRIPLAAGKGFMLVDAEDAPLMRRFRWRLIRKRGSASCYAATVLAGRPTVHAHRLILNARAREQVRHLNGDGLDNRKANLQLCTNAQITKGKRRRADSPYRFKGIFYRHGRWRAKICVDGRQIHGGTFPTDEEAARAYDALARQHHGVWARLNFPDQVLPHTAPQIDAPGAVAAAHCLTALAADQTPAGEAD